MAEIGLVLGGVRSGKSAFAEELVRAQDRSTLYLATGQATDAEMTERIRRHRERRPGTWTTLEEPLALADSLANALVSPRAPEVVLIDSLDGWVGNLLIEHEAEPASRVEHLARDAIEQLLETCVSRDITCIVVSSEVGLSLVSPNLLGRRFQDLLGLVNQQVAAAAHRVYLVVAGIPVTVKGN